MPHFLVRWNCPTSGPNEVQCLMQVHTGATGLGLKVTWKREIRFDYNFTESNQEDQTCGWILLARFCKVILTAIQYTRAAQTPAQRPNQEFGQIHLLVRGPLWSASVWLLVDLGTMMLWTVMSAQMSSCSAFWNGGQQTQLPIMS